MTRVLSVVLLGVIAVLAAEPAYAQQRSRRVGIGAALGDVSDVLLQLEVGAVIAPVILIPVQVTEGFRLEPEIGVCRSSVKEIASGPVMTRRRSMLSPESRLASACFLRRCKRTFGSTTASALVTPGSFRKTRSSETRERSRLTDSLLHQPSAENICFQIGSASGQKFSFDIPL